MEEKKYIVITHHKDGDVSITPKGKSYCTYQEALEIQNDFAGYKVTIHEINF